MAVGASASVNDRGDVSRRSLGWQAGDGRGGRAARPRAGAAGGSAAELEAHQRETDDTGHQEPSDVPPTRSSGIADGSVSINDDRHCNDP
jgi:hypothetical protein